MQKTPKSTKRTATNQKRAIEIREAANGDVPTADLEFMNQQQLAMGKMANAVAQMQVDQAANDEIGRNQMRADVVMAIGELKNAQHKAHERERMQAEVAKVHQDRSAAD